MEVLEQQLRERLSLEFRLESLGSDRYAVITPFTFDDGDRFPIVLEKTNGRWRITDEGGVVMHLSYLDVPFEEGNRARLIENIAERHSIELSDWMLIKPIDDTPDADALMTFIHAIAQVADVEFLARDVVASTFMEDFRAYLRRTVRLDSLRFDYFDEQRDPERIYRADAAIRMNGSSLFGFGVANETRARDATITLLTYEQWYGSAESFVVFEDQVNLPRRPLAQLSNVVGKQFATLVGQEPRITEYLQRAGVPLISAEAQGDDR